LELSFAPFQRRKAASTKGTTAWYKEKLAAAGFHPGPIDGDAGAPEYVLALAEFQRSHPKEASAPFTRLEAKGAEGADTEGAPAGAAPPPPPADTRPFFGDPASRADHPHATAEGLLPDKDQALIVWADDRHGFTDENPLVLVWLGGRTVPVGADRMLMEKYR